MSLWYLHWWFVIFRCLPIAVSNLSTTQTDLGTSIFVAILENLLQVGQAGTQCATGEQGDTSLSLGFLGPSRREMIVLGQWAIDDSVYEHTFF